MPKTYTSVPNVTTGDVYTASTYNTMTAQNINNLVVRPMCRVKQSAGQSINDATSTVINFDQEDFDTDGMHDTVTNNSRITIQTAGVYLIVGSCNYTAGVDADASVNILKNGAGGVGGYAAFGPANTTAGHTTSVILNLAVNDYVQLSVYQNNSANTSRTTDTTATYLNAVWLGQVS